MRKKHFYKKYALTKAELYSAKYYALRYPEWLDQYNSLKDSVSAISYENADMPHAVNKIGCPTEDLAEKRAEIRAKMEKVEKACMQSDKELFDYLIRYVIDENATYVTIAPPCGPSMFYERVRKVYYNLAKEI